MYVIVYSAFGIGSHFQIRAQSFYFRELGWSDQRKQRGLRRWKVGVTRQQCDHELI
jgi:hypothetical protein